MSVSPFLVWGIGRYLAVLTLDASTNFVGAVGKGMVSPQALSNSLWESGLEVAVLHNITMLGPMRLQNCQFQI